MFPRFIRAAAFAGLACAGIQASGADQLPVVPVDTEIRVRQFLEAFINPDQTPEQQATFFREDVQYYGLGKPGRREIVRDIRHYAKRWPDRSYRLADIEFIRPDPGTDDVFVSYVVDFQVASPERSIGGRALYGAVITDLHTDPRITLIMEKVPRRRSDLSAGTAAPATSGK
ncbi:hypothetical protein SAMN06265795_104274 [Noviherbaspirillum humi]|uniref:SnoaL-like domain-containing protein n=1 Tax=Noviherbaspirillum humi TaxID=1688639 RepID=A0A239G6Q8_9BURK|nr:hypothetical protein [Noviherbaspirillum humi]SNS64761.1 hypothetical protein SAMN06265795_104274 [Noviherbaspirillum humi]